MPAYRPCEVADSVFSVVQNTLDNTQRVLSAPPMQISLAMAFIPQYDGCEIRKLNIAGDDSIRPKN